MSRRTTQTHAITNVRLKAAREQRCWSQEEVADRVGTSAVNVSRWERGVTHPTPHFRAKLCALFGKDAHELGLLAEQQPLDTAHETEQSAPDTRIWSVPYSRNPFFTGRDDILQRLHAVLHQQHATALTQSWALSGLGGIGKTQTALEYAYRHRQDYQCIFWANAATRDSLLADFVKIAALLGLPQKDEPDHERIVSTVKTWFATHADWLLMLDNADDVASARDFLPPERPGHLILTSRAQALGSLAEGIEMTDMGLAEGMQFLLRRAKLLAPGMPLDQVAEEHLAAAEAIVIELAFLPLAIDQAGAYIDEVGCSLAAYRELYGRRRQELLQRRGHVPTDYPASVATTWSLSFQQVAQANPAAATVLHLCAFLEPDSIPEDIFMVDSDGWNQSTQDTLLLNDAIEELRRFSLIQRASDTKTLRIHRLVQAVLQGAMDETTRRQWAERAVRATNAVFPRTIEVETWPQVIRYLPQAQACSLLIQEQTFTFPEAASLLVRTAQYIDAHALYEQAAQVLLQALHIQEQASEPEQLDIAVTLNSLAGIRRKQGKYEQAEPLYQRALDISEHALGPQHPETADILHDFALFLQQCGHTQEAADLFQRALAIRERSLGAQHPKTLETASALAALQERWPHPPTPYGEGEPYAN